MLIHTWLHIPGILHSLTSARTQYEKVHTEISNNEHLMTAKLIVKYKLVTVTGVHPLSVLANSDHDKTGVMVKILARN